LSIASVGEMAGSGCLNVGCGETVPHNRQRLPRFICDRSYGTVEGPEQCDVNVSLSLQVAKCTVSGCLLETVSGCSVMVDVL